MTASPLQAPYCTFFDSNGDPLSGGKVYTYTAGTTTPKNSYTSSSGLVANANPVILDAAGRADIYLIGSYRIDVYTATDSLVESVDNLSAFSTGGNMDASVYDPANIAQQILGTTAVQTATNKSLVLASGGASLAPLTFSTGTNLTTATAGSVEYDGKVIYATPQSTQRGVVPAEQFYSVNSAIVGANGTSAQNIFGVGVTLSGSTIYEFEAAFAMSKSAGTTSHGISLLFGGTASLNNIGYQITGDISSTSFTSGFGTRYSAFPQVATAVASFGSLTSATVFVVYILKGVVSVNAGGTFIPQYILSAAPGGAYTTAVGSYFKIKPIGASGANVSVGAWA